MLANESGVDEKILNILRTARDIITPDGAWTQGKSAADSNGERIPCRSEYAVSFCLLGAIDRATAEFGDDASYAQATLRVKEAIVRTTGETNPYIPKYNDTPGRTQGEVLGILDYAITMENLAQ